MNKREYFILAMKNRKYSKSKWNISVFSKTENLVGDSPYDIIIKDDKYYFYDENMDLFPIDDSDSTDRLIDPFEQLILSPNDVVNLSETITTTYGILFTNYFLIIEPFRNLIPYINKLDISIPDIENKILPLYADDNNEIEKDPNKIYTSDYLRYTTCVLALCRMSQLFQQGITRKGLTPPPNLEVVKNKEIEDNKDQMNNVTVIAKIDKNLRDLDKEWLKDDDSELFLISNKSRAIVRKKMFLTLGAEAGLDDSTVNATFIKNSLSEGWDVDKFPDMNNNLRAGSYSRGAETELGGVEVKWLLRASSNMNITVDDCNSTLGSPIKVDKSNIRDIVGFSIINKGETIAIEDEIQAEQYLGNTVLWRNPMYCKLTSTDYCKVCVGKRLAINPTALSMAVSSYGSVLMSIKMAAAHAKELSLATMDLNSAII